MTESLTRTAHSRVYAMTMTHDRTVPRGRRPLMTATSALCERTLAADALPGDIRKRLTECLTVILTSARSDKFFVWVDRIREARSTARRWDRGPAAQTITYLGDLVLALCEGRDLEAVHAAGALVAAAATLPDCDPDEVHRRYATELEELLDNAPPAVPLAPTPVYACALRSGMHGGA